MVAGFRDRVSAQSMAPLMRQRPLRKAAARINRLAGRSGARIVGYPRITYVIRVSAAKHVSLTTASADAAAILPACLDPSDLRASQQVGDLFLAKGIQAVGYPSAIPGFAGR